MEFLHHSQTLYSAITIRSLQHIKAEKGALVESHRHPFTEFIHCLSGTIEQHIGQQLYRLTAGDSLIIKAGYFHHTLILEDTTFLGFHFDLEDATVSKLFQSSTADCQINYDIDDGKELGQLIHALIDTQQLPISSESDHHSLAVQESLEHLETHSRILLVICKLARYLTTNQQSVGLPKHSELFIAETAAKLLKDNLWKPYSIGQLSNDLNLHRTYISTIFSRIYGISPKSFQQNLKLERAKILLLESNQPIEGIAERLNFSASSHFSKFFLAKTGVSPSDFRNRIFQDY